MATSETYGDDSHKVGMVFVIDHPYDLDRVDPECWMFGRIRVGDIVLATHKVGSFKFDYILLERKGDSYKGLPCSMFQAHTLGSPHKFQPTTDQFVLLFHGHTVKA